MSFIKYLVAIGLAVGIYLGLSKVYEPLAVSTILHNKESVVDSNSYWIDLTSFAFAFICLVIFLMMTHTKKNLGTYLRSITYSIIVIIILLVINECSIIYISQSIIDENIMLKPTINYGFFYYTPTLLIFPIFLKQFTTLINGNTFIYKYKYLADLKLDIRILRLMAKIMDILLVIFLAYFFSKIIVIHPDFNMMALCWIFVYSFAVEYSFGTSIGKLLFGLKVISTSEKKLSGAKILLRTLCRLIPLYSITILFNKKGIHDYISKTMVVPVNIPIEK
jgi:hypothetical protein